MIRASRLAAACLPVLLLAACAVQPPAPVERGQAAAPAVPSPAEPARGKPGPIPVRAINANTRCVFTDEGGTSGRLELQIEDSSVRRFAAEVTIPKHGTCAFDLKDFRQVPVMLPVTLKAKDNRCQVHVWEQGSQVTVAFSECQRYCAGRAFDYLWPIFADTRSGECS